MQIPHWLLMLDKQVDTGGRPPWEASGADSRYTLLGVLSALLQPPGPRCSLSLCLHSLFTGMCGPPRQSPALNLVRALLCDVLPPLMCWWFQDLHLYPEPRAAGLPLLHSCFSSLFLLQVLHRLLDSKSRHQDTSHRPLPL